MPLLGALTPLALVLRFIELLPLRPTGRLLAARYLLRDIVLPCPLPGIGISGGRCLRTPVGRGLACIARCTLVVRREILVVPLRSAVTGLGRSLTARRRRARIAVPSRALAAGWGWSGHVRCAPLVLPRELIVSPRRRALMGLGVLGAGRRCLAHRPRRGRTRRSGWRLGQVWSAPLFLLRELSVGPSGSAVARRGRCIVLTGGRLRNAGQIASGRRH